MTTLDEILSGGRDHRDSLRTARKIIKDVPEIVVEIVQRYVEHRWRNDVRSIERQAFPLPASDDSAEHILEAVNALKGLPVTVTRGQPPVEWLYLTREQHGARIAHLTTLRGGIDDTIQRHRAAIALIDSRGVDRLIDIEIAEAS